MFSREQYRSTFWLALLLVLSPVSADHPTVVFGSEASGPINTLAATAMPAGKWALGLRNEILDRDAFSDARLAGLAAQGLEGVHTNSYPRARKCLHIFLTGRGDAITPSRSPRSPKDKTSQNIMIQNLFYGYFRVFTPNCR